MLIAKFIDMKLCDAPESSNIFIRCLVIAVKYNREFSAATTRALPTAEQPKMATHNNCPLFTINVRKNNKLNFHCWALYFGGQLPTGTNHLLHSVYDLVPIKEVAIVPWSCAVCKRPLIPGLYLIIVNNN